MSRKTILLAIILSICSRTLIAGEGMWIPLLLKQLNESDMQSNGLKLTAEDIYSVNNSSLKDAIVHFGGGCTSEIISSDGLLLTNHHCGYGQIQSHSSVENDYLTDGYWAMNQSQELPNKGLTATFIKRIEDVTTEVLKGTSDLDKKEKKRVIEEHIKEITKRITDNEEYEAFVRPFYYGNEYYLFVTETFKDVRLVGAPPSSIGKYGFDTDNWIWPRHTGDFSIFRIYADKNNKPAEFSKDNVPYKPGHYLPISLKGVKKGDFTMVYGFPGRTQEYLSSYAVELIQKVSDPLKVHIRTEKLKVLDAEMAKSDVVRIKYAAKQSRTSNSWKKWKGEIRGLKKLDAINKKRALESNFNEKVQSNSSFEEYNGLLDQIKEKYGKMEDITVSRDYFIEAGYWGTDILRQASMFRTSLDKYISGEAPTEKQLTQYKNSIKKYFKDFDKNTDQLVFARLMELYNNAELKIFKPTMLGDISKEYKGDFQAYAAYVYGKSIFASEATMNNLLENWNKKTPKTIAKDPAFVIMKNIFDNYFEQIRPAYNSLNSEITVLSKLYMKGLREVLPDAKKYYPDANSTLRIAYGKIDDYQPNDAVQYDYYTTLDGVVEKYNPDVKEFDLPEKLLELHENKDYGQYGENDELKVCFIASNHTTGGNSGSPVLNGNGELIGLNFDRNWEGTMSDIMYDPDQCRNIAVDIRYVLFIVDKFAGASYLLDHMKLIK